MKSPPLSIIIVNWNSGHYVAQCVDSIRSCFIGRAPEIIVVDNASSDNSMALIENRGDVKFIGMGENSGFARACNAGAKEASGDCLLFLNPDAVVFQETISAVLTFMQASKNSNVGICGVQLIDENGQVARSCARFPRTKNFILSILGLDKLIPSLGLSMIEWDHATTRQVDQVIGAFFVVRRKVFDAVGGFDERFFVYFEEVDFSYRARQFGWSSTYLSTAKAFHAGGGTSRQVKAKRLFYFLRSRLLYSFKHFSFFQAVFVLLVCLLIEPFTRSLWCLAKISLSGVKETFSAYGMLLRWLPQWWFKGVTR